MRGVIASVRPAYAPSTAPSCPPFLAPAAAAPTLLLMLLISTGGVSETCEKGGGGGDSPGGGGGREQKGGVGEEGAGVRGGAGEEGGEREGGKPACVDGTAKGRWVNYTWWEADDCEYSDFSGRDLHECLKGQWIHFFGDQTSRTLSTFFAKKMRIKKRASSEGDSNERASAATDDSNEDGERAAAGARGWQPVPRSADRPTVSYLFRAKMAHQRAPAPGDLPEDDVNNFFFDALQDPSADRPDVLIMSMGAHEVFGWSGRPRVKLNLTVYKEDTEELLGKVLGSFPEQRVIWWKAHYIQQAEGDQVEGALYPTRQDQGGAVIHHSEIPQPLPAACRRPLCCQRALDCGFLWNYKEEERGL
ncbi:unnamed protein product [Closterium sp. Yama58-4]|nr:unnamed protein product [Closterium sp. Yama58-4]